MELRRWSKVHSLPPVVKRNMKLLVNQSVTCFCILKYNCISEIGHQHTKNNVSQTPLSSWPFHPVQAIRFGLTRSPDGHPMLQTHIVRPGGESTRRINLLKQVQIRTDSFNCPRPTCWILSSRACRDGMGAPPLPPNGSVPTTVVTRTESYVRFSEGGFIFATPHHPGPVCLQVSETPFPLHSSPTPISETVAGKSKFNKSPFRNFKDRRLWCQQKWENRSKIIHLILQMSKETRSFSSNIIKKIVLIISKVCLQKC